MLVPFWSLRRSRLRSKGWKKKPKRLGTPGLKWRCFLFGMIFQMENDRKWRSTAAVPRKPQAWWRKAPPRWVFDNGLGMEGGGVDVTSLDHAVVAKCSEPWWCYLWIIQTGNQLRSFGRSLRGVSCAMMAWDYWLLLVGALEYFSLSLSLSIYSTHFHPIFCDHLHFADILPWRIATTGTQKNQWPVSIVEALDEFGKNLTQAVTGCHRVDEDTIHNSSI